MKFDEVLVDAYQRRLYLLVCLPVICTALTAMGPVFILDVPKHRCAISENDTYRIQDENHARLVNASIPYEKKNGDLTLSSCQVYSINSSDSNNTEKCHRWVYDISVFPETVATKFNLVCDNTITHSNSNMAPFVGSLSASLIMGYVSDVFGRKISFFIGVVLLTLSSIATAFSPNIYVFIVLRFIGAFSTTTVFMTGFVIGLELVGPSKRMLAGIGIQFFWSAGLFLLVLAAYFLRHWQTFQLVISVPSVLMLVIWWLIPESPRWLMSRGRLAEVEAILTKAAQVNGVELPANVFQQLSHQEPHTGKVYRLFSDSKIKNRAIIIFFNWAVVNMIYYGLSLNVQNLSGDIFLNFTVGSIVETVAYVVCVLTLNKGGRKILHCGSMLVGGLACVAVVFPVVYKGPDWVIILLTMIGRLGASGAFAVIYIFSGELFPTVVRNSSIGISSTCGKIGGIVSPYIADLGGLAGGALRVALPQVVFGTCSVVAGSLSLYLPETLGRKLPETIDDIRTLGKSDEDLTDNLPMENGVNIQLKTMKTNTKTDINTVK